MNLSQNERQSSFYTVQSNGGYLYTSSSYTLSETNFYVPYIAYKEADSSYHSLT